jgi:hypothetical protein
VNVVKSAFPTASAGWIAAGRLGQAEGMGDIERANVRRFKQLIHSCRSTNFIIYRETIRQPSSSMLKRTCSNFKQSQMSTPK